MFLGEAEEDLPPPQEHVLVLPVFLTIPKQQQINWRIQGARVKSWIPKHSWNVCYELQDTKKFFSVLYWTYPLSGIAARKKMQIEEVCMQ